MAFTASTFWHVRTTGDDVNHGGGFDIGVTGFPTDGAATDANTTAPVFTSASYNFVAGDVGAWVFIKSGTNWSPGWYVIVSVASNAATLNATIGSAVAWSANALVSPNTIVGCATVASPTGATWGLDYSQQANSQIAFSDMVIDSTTNTKFTSSGNPVGKNFIGNIISVTAGTGFTVQRVAIVSTSTTVATCDKALGTVDSTGGVGELGGPLASIGGAGSVAIAQNQVCVKAGSYAVTTASTNVATGCLSIPWSTQVALHTRIIGYNDVLGDNGTKPVITLNAGVANATLIAGSANNYGSVHNIELVGTSGADNTASRGIVFSGTWLCAYNCTLSKFSNNALVGNSVACYVHSCTTTYAVSGGAHFATEVYNCSGGGFTAGTAYVGCIASSCRGIATDGFTCSNATIVTANCVSYYNTGNGFTCVPCVVNCIAEANTLYGFSSGKSTILIKCATYNNSGGTFTGEGARNDCIAVTVGSVFVDAVNRNFALNSSVSCGALLRAVGYPATFPAGLTANYRDIGAAQHREAARTSGFSG